VACAAILSVACAGASGQPARTFKPNEIQVIEPEGQPDKWTYGPSVLKVAKGTSVTIVNPGSTATFTFDKVGSFAYHCGVHPQMTGVVQVCDGACG
jgi:plastocyanin